MKKQFWIGALFFLLLFSSFDAKASSLPLAGKILERVYSRLLHLEEKNITRAELPAAARRHLFFALREILTGQNTDVAWNDLQSAAREKDMPFIAYLKGMVRYARGEREKAGQEWLIYIKESAKLSGGEEVLFTPWEYQGLRRALLVRMGQEFPELNERAQLLAAGNKCFPVNPRDRLIIVLFTGFLTLFVLTANARTLMQSGMVFLTGLAGLMLWLADWIHAIYLPWPRLVTALLLLTAGLLLGTFFFSIEIWKKYFAPPLPGYRRCPHCRLEIPRVALICPECRKKI